jgi:hypothetical protein
MSAETKKITMKLTTGGIGNKIFIEGKELENVRSVTVQTDSELTKVYVEFINVEIDIEGEAEVTTNQEEEENG